MADLGRGPVAVDTAVFIYFIEEQPRFLPLIATLFKAVARGKRQLVTSGLTLLEVLVVPYRAGNHSLAERYEDALQLAAAITARCHSFLTNDRRLPEIPGLRVLQLESYVESAV